MMATSLLDKLKVGRTEGKKGSKVRLVLNDAEKADFDRNFDAHVGGCGGEDHRSSGVHVQKNGNTIAEDVDHGGKGGICSGECFGKMEYTFVNATSRLLCVRWRTQPVGISMIC